MPFKSKAQRRYFYSQLPQLAAEWESHTPKGKKLPAHVRKKRRKLSEKKAFVEGFFSVLEKAGELGPLPIEDYRVTSGMLGSILRDDNLSGAQKNVLIAQLNQRPHGPIETHRELMGAEQDPLRLAMLNSYLRRRQYTADQESNTWGNLLSLDSLNRIFFGYPIFGDMQVGDRRRKPEEEWESPWKVTPV